MWMAIFLVACGLVAVPVVSAHAHLVESDPADGERLTEPPAEIRLEFDGTVENAEVNVITANRTRVDDGPVEIHGDRDRVVSVPVEDLGGGSYRVYWRIQSVDGHTTDGTFSFVVEQSTPTSIPTSTAPSPPATKTPTANATAAATPTASPTPTPTPTYPVVEQDPPPREEVLAGALADGFRELDPVEALARGLLFTATLLIVGLPLAITLVVRPVLGRSGAVRRRTRRLVAGAGGTLLVSALLLAVVRLTDVASAVSPTAIATFLRSSLGVYAVLQVAAAVAVLAATAYDHRAEESPGLPWLGGITAAGLVVALTVSLSSHSASSVGSVGVLADLEHLFGAAAWVGGVAALALVVPPALRALDASERARTVVRLVRRFSLLAVTGVGLAAATGLLIATWHVPAPYTLEGTAYGKLLSAKVLFVIGALVAGGLNHAVFGRLAGPRGALADGGRSVAPSREALDSWFVRAVRVEFALLLIVTLLAGVLTGVPTADHQSAAADPVPLYLEGDDEPRTKIKLTPGTVGYSVVDVAFGDDRHTADGPVTVRMRHAEAGLHRRQVADPGDDGRHSAVVHFPTDGRWILTVNGTVDGRQVDEQFTAFVRSPDGDHDHGAVTDDEFATLLRRGSAVVGLGTLVALLAGLGFRRRT